MRRLLLAGVLAFTGNGAWPRGLNAPASLPLDQVTTLRVSAVTDSALVLSWTEVSTHGSGVARYAVRVGSLSQGPFVWANAVDVASGGCAYPVYGSTAGGGRVRSCVLSGLAPNNGYFVQLVAYTGTLATTTTFSPLSNVVQGTTATRVGPMLVTRPRMLLDTVVISAVEVSDFAGMRFPLRGTFRLGDRLATFFDATGVVVAQGYLLVIQP